MFDKWPEILDEGDSVDVIYLDLAKAFDTVPHQRLLIKLSGYGIGRRILEWIKQFLIGRKQKVRIGQAESAWSGVEWSATREHTWACSLCMLYQ